MAGFTVVGFQFAIHNRSREIFLSISPPRPEPFHTAFPFQHTCNPCLPRATAKARPPTNQSTPRSSQKPSTRQPQQNMLCQREPPHDDKPHQPQALHTRASKPPTQQPEALRTAASPPLNQPWHDEALHTTTSNESPAHDDKPHQSANRCPHQTMPCRNTSAKKPSTHHQEPCPQQTMP